MNCQILHLIIIAILRYGGPYAMALLGLGKFVSVDMTPKPNTLKQCTFLVSTKSQKGYQSCVTIVEGAPVIPNM